MRLSKPNTSIDEKERIAKFAKWLLEVGDGKVCDIKDPNDSDASWIEIPDDMLIATDLDPISSIFHATYPDFDSKYNNFDYIRERTIITPKNVTVSDINDYVVSLLPGNTVTYLSADTICPTTDNASNLNISYPPELLNNIDISGVPSHKLVLKKGMPVMLLRNINQTYGLCNGTRLIITNLFDKVVETRVLTDDAILNSGICNIKPSLKQKSTWQRFSKLFYAPEIMTLANRLFGTALLKPLWCKGDAKCKQEPRYNQLYPPPVSFIMSRQYSLRSQGPSSHNICSICWSDLTTGQGQAIFTADCSHSFHHPCIANNVHHGNLCCPACRAKWDKSKLPFQVPPLQQNKAKHGFDDDEPLSSAALPQSSGPQNVTIKTYTETSAIPAAYSRPQYPVLVSICAPPLQDPDGEARTPIDLVIILDKVLPLRRMTIDGRESAIQAFESLEAGGGTDIVEGLKKGAHILEERRERNPVANIILLSDGQDNYSRVPSQMLKKLPASVRSSGMQHEIPVHTFGFGKDHDAKIMHAISDASGGTFSYIESVGIIQDAFALCIGGLLSVVSQELRLTVRSASPGVVKIVSIPSGRYVSQISDEQGVVDVGNMYGEEEKQFLISRPEFCSPAELAVSLDVDRQRNRLLVADAIGEAQRLAELGNLEAARAVLTHPRETLLTSTAAKAGDDVSHLFEAELKDIMDKMASMNLYEQAGSAYALSGMSSHARQSASARGAAAGSCLAANGPRKQLATQAARKSTYGKKITEQEEVILVLNKLELEFVLDFW
ncbi:hypothetical protein ACLB2K_032647 [Fragaria x ananassa]